MKQWMKPNKLEWVSFLILMPFIAIAINYLFFKEKLWQDRDIWLYSVTTIFLIGLCNWYLHVASTHLLREIFPDVKHIVLRTLLLTATHMSLMWLVVNLYFVLYANVNIVPYEINKSSYWPLMIACQSVSFTGTPLWEIDFYFKKWKETTVEKERVQELTLKLEFELLRQQVDPHFLFNCFNTLSSLMTEDITQAQLFLKELRKVYQYLLDNKKEEFTTIENELSFIGSYYALLFTRFGNALQLNIVIEEKYKVYLIPSLSLQLLVENAVKHNIVSKKQKLFITITNSSTDELIVTNNLQQKNIQSKSFGIGMETILTKYKLAQQKGLEVLNDGKTYKVVLPLIHPNVFNSGSKL